MGRKKSSGRSIRRWIRIYIEEGDLPVNHYGWWNVSILEDEDVTAEIRLHCAHIGKYVTAAHIVEFLDDPSVRARLGLQKSITVRTAERWLHRSGYKWGKAWKGQYFEGHEREDVVAYRQTKYIPAWKKLESRMAIYTPDGEVIDLLRTLPLDEGVKPVVVWFHDESTFFAHDRRLIRWVYVGEHPTLAAKGEGNSVMVARFVCAERGWMRGRDGQSAIAQKVLRAGKNRDGYFTNEDVVEQLRNAIELVHREYPDQTHVFVYDNAPSHMKRPVGAVSAVAMTKGPKKDFTFKTVNSHGAESLVRMEDGCLHDGTRQSFYFSDDHPTNPGWFKGMKNILIERGLPHLAEKNAQCNPRCDPEATDCCCRRALSCEPDFETRDTIIEELAHSLGSEVIVLPKYHCELNPIEQCWGYAKARYRLFPDSSTQAKLEDNMLKALDSIPEHTFRKFAARSRRFLDAYAAGKSGKEAAEWVNHKESKFPVHS
ncbi:hypothetical protein BDV93DRAFT_535125 [Ceratobasidium sp. AG-I]|nr:hypothetical protein BDV93DRAFT_535125 [Ceratobasidium sp. AG-I]